MRHDYLEHGAKWSEEAKQRVRTARKAGRSVREMFADVYKGGNRFLRNTTKSVGRFLDRVTPGYKQRKFERDIKRDFKKYEKDNKKFAASVNKRAKVAERRQAALRKEVKAFAAQNAKDMARMDKEYEKGEKLVNTTLNTAFRAANIVLPKSKEIPLLTKGGDIEPQVEAVFNLVNPEKRIRRVEKVVNTAEKIANMGRKKPTPKAKVKPKKNANPKRRKSRD